MKEPNIYISAIGYNESSPAPPVSSETDNHQHALIKIKSPFVADALKNQYAIMPVITIGFRWCNPFYAQGDNVILHHKYQNQP